MTICNWRSNEGIPRYALIIWYKGGLRIEWYWKGQYHTTDK